MTPPWRYIDLAAFTHHNFRLYIAGQTFNQVGTRIQEVAAGWLMWELTGSATWVGALAVVDTLPRLILWPLAGSLADRFDRRKLAMWVQTLSMIEALLLAALSAAGMIDTYGLLFFTALIGVNGAFWQPVRLAVIPRLVPRETLPSAVALASVSANIARVVGPIFAGPVLILGSATTAFALNSLSFAGVVLAFWMMRLPADHRPRRKGALANPPHGSGFSVVVRHLGIATLIGFVAIFAICVRPIGELLPVLAESVFSAGPAGLAILVSARGFGALFSGLIISGRQDFRLLTVFMSVAGVLGSLVTAAIAVAPNFSVAVVCVALMGLTVTLTNIAAQILLQLSLSDEVRGRILSVYGMLSSSAPGIGALCMGWVADRIGIAAPILVGAVIGLAASLLIFHNRGTLARHLEDSADRQL